MSRVEGLPRRVRLYCTGGGSHRPHRKKTLDEWLICQDGWARPVPWQVRTEDRSGDELRRDRLPAPLPDRSGLGLVGLDVTCTACRRPGSRRVGDWDITPGGVPVRARGHRRVQVTAERMTKLVAGALDAWPDREIVTFDVASPGFARLT